MRLPRALVPLPLQMQLSRLIIDFVAIYFRLCTADFLIGTDD